jgi:hypothetical protein
MRYHEGSLVSGSAAKPLAHVRDRELIRDCLQRRGITGAPEPLPGKPGLHLIRRALERPVSISVLLVARANTRGDARATSWENCEVVTLTDDGRLLPECLNAAARAASGELLIIVDSAIRPVAGWREALVPHLLRPEIGLVTAKLVCADNRLFSCGLVLGIRGTAAPWHFGRPADDTGYNAWMALDHEVSAVPIDCMAVRRQLFLDSGGFDTGYDRMGFDVDLALRLTSERGLRHLALASVTCTLPVPFQDVSAPSEWPEHDIARLWSHWGAVLRRGDPHFNPNLSLYDEGMACLDREEAELRARGVFTAYDSPTSRALAAKWSRGAGE